MEVMPQANYAGLIHNLNRWRLQGFSIETMELMMDEFANHPDWCRRSRVPPWRVFVAKREDLASLVAYRKRKDPANRRWSGGKDWFGHTPAVNSLA